MSHENAGVPQEWTVGGGLCAWNTVGTKHARAVCSASAGLIVC